MRIFDNIDASTIERRELHLWILALTVLVVMTIGLALMMYPAVFERSVVLNGPMLKNTFFSFCALSFLLVGYIVDRQMVIRQLRRVVAREARHVKHLRQQASTDMLAALPGLDRFKDCLAMEHRRACNTHQPISLLTVVLTSNPNVKEPSEIVMTYGDALKALSRKLRGEDSVYQFAPGVFGIVLPGVSLPGAQSVARRVSEGLHDASGADSRFKFELKIINYPDDVITAREMEEAVRTVLPEEYEGAGERTVRDMAMAGL